MRKTFNDTIVLLGVESISYDEDRNELATKEEIEVFCNVESAGRQEFYRAGNTGYKPTYIFTVNDFEYDGQEQILYKDSKYEVVRTYKDNNYIEITVGEKLGEKF